MEIKGDKRKMSNYGHEDVVKISRVEKLKPHYRKPFFFGFFIIFVLMIIVIWDKTISEYVDTISGLPISRIIGYIMAIPLLIIAFRPTWIRVGDVFYQKTVLTTKWDYDQYRAAVGWRKWFT